MVAAVQTCGADSRCSKPTVHYYMYEYGFTGVGVESGLQDQEAPATCHL